MSFQKDPEKSENKALHRFADFGDKRVLEVGSGEGRLTWKYARSAQQVVGIDTEMNGLRVATIETPSDLRKSIFFTRASSLNLPFPHETFDLALLSWSL